MPEREGIPTAFLISGEGTTAEAAILACQYGKIINIRPAVVIASRHDAPGLARAKALGIPTEVVVRSDFKGQSEAFGDALLNRLRHYGVGLVSQNGWLPKTPPEVIKAFSGYIINQHPGRLPPFGGVGMFGRRVTYATLDYFASTGEEDLWTASVVHHVTAAYDEGPLIQVRRLDVGHLRNSPDLLDWTNRVQDKLLPVEHENVIGALNAFGEGNVPTAEFDRTPFQEDVLQLAKQRAIQLFPNG